VDEVIVGGGLLDTPDEVILPNEFSGISPSEPGERGSVSGIWEWNREGY
jgi:hypothetical protein